MLPHSIINDAKSHFVPVCNAIFRDGKIIIGGADSFFRIQTDVIQHILWYFIRIHQRPGIILPLHPATRGRIWSSFHFYHLMYSLCKEKGDIPKRGKVKLL